MLKKQVFSGRLKVVIELTVLRDSRREFHVVGRSLLSYTWN